jgi:hypothetical protein
MIGGHPWYVI